MPRITVWHQSWSGAQKVKQYPFLMCCTKAHMGYFVLALVQVDNLSFLLTHSISTFTSEKPFHFCFYHSNFQVSGVLPSAFGQFELPALDKKPQSPLWFPCDAIILRKDVLISERDSGYLKQWSERRIITWTNLVVPRVYGLEMKG